MTKLLNSDFSVYFMLGFIGAGKMSSALMQSIIDSGLYSSENIIASDVFAPAIERVSSDLGVRVTANNKEVVQLSEIIFICTKPVDVLKVLEDVSGSWGNDKILVSIAAGIRISDMKSVLKNSKIVRVMPNTPCLVGKMAAGFFHSDNLKASDVARIEKILQTAGLAYELDETKLDAVTGLSGSGPAFVARFIDYFIKAGIDAGLPEDVSKGLAIQTFQGTAKLINEKGISPEDLIDLVSSPNGTTVAGREVLEKSDVSEVIRSTIRRAKERSIELGDN